MWRIAFPFLKPADQRRLVKLRAKIGEMAAVREFGDWAEGKATVK